jgi:zinc transport system substrate-binding protein
VAKDPVNKVYYEKNRDEFLKQLKNLDSLYRNTLAKAPKKDFITQHAAFDYLAKNMGLNKYLFQA